MYPNDGRVVSNFIVQVLLGRDLTVYGEGLQTRSFCVDDLIDGVVRLMAAPAEITGPINIGNPTEFSIIELAEMVISLVGHDHVSFGGRFRRMTRSSRSQTYRWRRSSWTGDRTFL
jgi:nucleoside-diphosphate-sugar epimerase